MEKKRQSPSNPRGQIWRYAGLGGQMLASIGLALFVGYKADQWLSTMPLISCALPLLVLVGIFIRLIRETSRSKKNEPKQLS